VQVVDFRGDARFNRIRRNAPPRGGDAGRPDRPVLSVDGDSPEPLSIDKFHVDWAKPGRPCDVHAVR